MRLDLYLKVSRLIQRRTLAQEFCDAGLIEVNGSAAKSGKEIKVGDKITINRRNRKITIQTVAVPEKKQVSKESAGDLFTVISDEQIEST
jgi:ribosomal 50S subunit-recycling heat shock protein